ncbi:UNVERIFIED_CONTAM: hypothetical protein GTU68_018320, partial [Idotea baltica]|nr:hypothetical protein [Idotea baltica]
MLDEKEPPLAEKGAVKWIRENLFSSWMNIFLTLISLYVIYLVLAMILPWAFGGVWNAGSLTECREVLFSVYKGSHDGACWAVIEDRWLQILFGFYPPELYWRPILAFVLFFVALAPVLFADKVPGQLMWFSLAYPFLATWLIWGGSFWVPVFVATGFVVGFIALKVLGKIAGPIVANIGAIAVALVWLSVTASVRETYGELGRVGLRPIDSRQIGGFMLALIIGIAGIVLSLPLGILLALGRQSHLFIVNKICVTFIEVIRGVPLIVWLFTGSLLLNYFLPPGTNFDLLLRVIIMVTLFSSAYIAEVIRGGLAALPTGQYEGADSLGLSYWQSMQLIVLPQAMKISIPGIVNTFIGLFKDTVLVVFIG